MALIPRELYFLFKTFGVLPVSQRGCRLTFSRSTCVWSIILVTIQNLLTLYVLGVNLAGGIREAPIKMKTYTAVLTVLLDVFSHTTSSVVSVILPSIHCHKMIRVYTMLRTFDGTLNSKPWQSDTRQKIYLYFTYLTLLIPLQVCRSFYKYLTLQSWMYYIPFLTLNYNCIANIIHFYHVVMQINHRFRIVNFHLKQENGDSISGFEDYISTYNFIPVNAPTANKIRSLMDGYWLLCEAIHTTTVFYHYQLLVLTFNLLVHMTLCLYYSAISLENQHLSISMQMPWLLLYTFLLVLLCRPGTAVTDSANETIRLVGKLLNYNLHPGIRKQLDLFMLTLPHHNVAVSVCGLFAVQNGIITSIAASVTTYMMTLLQFQAVPSHLLES